MGLGAVPGAHGRMGREGRSAAEMRYDPLGHPRYCWSTLVLTIFLHLKKDDSSKKPELKLDLPEVLRVFLVDDWEAVTKNKQVHCPS